MSNIKANLINKIGTEFSSKNVSSGEGGDFKRDLISAINTSEGHVNEEGEIEEKWSEKYKRSIDCKNPKGFSQRAHCQGKKKKENKEATGASSAGAFDTKLFAESKKTCKLCKKELSKCKCDKKKKTETKEATGASSAGSYVTPAAWAKSSSKKDWRGRSKTQIPGGKFVTIKKKCKKFPYCNQGDITSLNIFEQDEMKRAIKNVSIKYDLPIELIKEIISQNLKKRINP